MILKIYWDTGLEEVLKKLKYKEKRKNIGFFGHHMKIMGSLKGKGR